MLVRCWLAAVAAVAVWLLRGVWCTEATVAVIRSVPSRCVSTLGRCDTARAVVSVVSVFWDVVFLGRWVALVVLVAGVPLGPATSRVVVIAVIAVIGRSNE